MKKNAILSKNHRKLTLTGAFGMKLGRGTRFSYSGAPKLRENMIFYNHKKNKDIMVTRIKIDS